MTMTDAQPVPGRKAATVTIETTFPAEDIEPFYRVYWKSWEGMLDRSPCRQYLRLDEFRDEMKDDRVLKFVLWDEHCRPAAMAFAASDLSVVPWVAPEFFSSRFPEHYREGRIFYIGSIIVHPTRRQSRAIYNLLAAITDHMVATRGIAAFDCSEYMRRHGWPDMIAKVGRARSVLDPQDLGEPQHYYAYVVDGPKPD
jgi:hypothetical protein